MEQIHSILRFPFEYVYEILTHPHHEFALILLGLLVAFGVLGQWVLYYKCNLPGIACIVPIWNIVVFLRIMGRPAWQAIFFMLPPPIIAYIIFTGDTSMAANIALLAFGLLFLGFTILIYVELCQCFGKGNFINYLLVLLFNGFYVMYLGMSGDTEYLGPVHGPKSIKKVQEA